jgi:hypothetical protein
MVQRFIRRRDGSVRVGRLVALLATTLALALFGTGLLAFTTRLTDDPVLRGAWVLLVTAMLKVPLVVVLWSFMFRNKEWPGQRVVWDGGELDEILRHLEQRAVEAESMGDRDARLAHLSREAWHVVDEVGGDAKIDALTVALRIDERLMKRGNRKAA